MRRRWGIPAQRLVARDGGPGARLFEEVSRRIVADDAALQPWCSDYLQVHRRRFLEDLELADRYTPPGTTILEVGAIPPIMTALLHRTGRLVTGLDIDPTRFSRSIGELGLDIRRCDVETEPIPFPEHHFDAVMMNEVFEHLRIDLLFSVGEVVRVLKPGGTLLLSTPNLSSFRGYGRLLLSGRAWAIDARPDVEFMKLRTLGHMGHVREYTPREVADFLASCGMWPVGLVYRGRPTAWTEWVAAAIRPSLLPFFSIIATKPASSGSATDRGSAHG